MHHRARSLRTLTSLALAALATTAARAGAAPMPADVESRVDKLVAQLTVDEKIDLVSGTRDFYTKAVKRLGIPEFKMTDGPVGTRNDGATTAYPAGALLAATWDPDLAQREGVSLGRDGRARGDHVLLGPGVNIYRVPQNGRNFEYLGEDPFLAGKMDVGYIRGVQSQGVAACVKHFVANNQETDRDFVDETIDERALREIFLPAFEAAVKDGHVWTIMPAYNKVNGLWMTANAPLLNDVLKKDWGFAGLAMSDWGAVHDTLGPANAGLDLEMPSDRYLNPKKLKPMLADGRVSQATLDDKVRRLLRVGVSMGWLDRPQKDASIPRDDPTSDATALAVARAGIVLLKNDPVNGTATLPLDRAKVHTIVLVGPNADQYVAGGGSSRAKPNRPVTLMQGLQALLGDGVKLVRIPYVGDLEHHLVDYAKGSTFDGPLTMSLFDNATLDGTAAATREDRAVNVNWRRRLPKGATSERFSARWTGKIHVDVAGPYAFALRSDDGSRVLLDGKTVLDDWSDHDDHHTATATVHLEPGHAYNLAVEYYNIGGDASILFGWGKPPEPIADADLATVASADAVIACVGTDETEGADRSYTMTGGQGQLIATVAARNPHTVVVLNAGGNVAMADWIDHVPALVDAWYPGQAGGKAIAEVLFGNVNPSGHLPDTFEKQWTDSPAYGHYPGGKGHVDYAEGVYVGYRWYDKKQIAPRFPFGFGLSYTTFAVANVRATPDGTTFDVTNTGKLPGATVAQVYVRPPAGGVDRPVQELKGFQRVDLQPGQTTHVSLPLDRRSYAYWDVTTHAWKVDAGHYEIAVGLSSRDLAGTAKVDVK